MWLIYVSIAVLNYYTSYHTSIGCEPSGVFHGRIPYKILDLKLGLRPERSPIPTSQTAQDVFDQTQMVYQDVRGNAIQAYIKYEVYYDKKANASKLKQADVLQSKADHYWSGIVFMEFRWIGTYILEKLLPDNNYLVRKIGNNKTQMLHGMQMRQFTTREPPPVVPTTPQDWKPAPEVTLKHECLYARAWGCEHEKPIFDAENNNVTTPKSPKIAVQSDSPNDETWITLETAQDCFRELFLQTEELCDVTDR